MDEYFECFLQHMGPETDRREVPASTTKKYRGILPELMLSHWENYGWSGYANGIFWTVNPAEYDAVVGPWLEQSGIANPDSYHVVARGAFGDLYLWQSVTGSKLTLDVNYHRFLLTSLKLSPSRADARVRSFFVSKNRTSNDFNGLFSKALNKLGPLQPDEMYGFVPAIALGGPGTLNTLQKVKTIEHLTFLSQLSPLTDWGLPDLNDFNG